MALHPYALCYAEQWLLCPARQGVTCDVSCASCPLTQAPLSCPAFMKVAREQTVVGSRSSGTTADTSMPLATPKDSSLCQGARLTQDHSPPGCTHAPSNKLCLLLHRTPSPLTPSRPATSGAAVQHRNASQATSLPCFLLCFLPKASCIWTWFLWAPGGWHVVCPMGLRWARTGSLPGLLRLGFVALQRPLGLSHGLCGCVQKQTGKLARSRGLPQAGLQLLRASRLHPHRPQEQQTAGEQ